MSFRQAIPNGVRNRDARLIALSTDQSTIQTYLHNVYNNEQIKRGPNKRNQIPTLSSITAIGTMDNSITPNAG